MTSRSFVSWFIGQNSLNPDNAQLNYQVSLQAKAFYFFKGEISSKYNSIKTLLEFII